MHAYTYYAIVLSAHVSMCLILGLYSTSDVAKMLAEIAKMENLRHLNVMSLIGVHLDMRLGLLHCNAIYGHGQRQSVGVPKEREKLHLS